MFIIMKILSNYEKFPSLHLSIIKERRIKADNTIIIIIIIIIIRIIIIISVRIKAVTRYALIDSPTIMLYQVMQYFKFKIV